MTTVLIADDQELVRAGFHLILDLEPDLHVVGEASDGAQCIQLAAKLHPDVILMDVRMPGIDGLEATRRLSAAGSTSRVLMLTTFDLDEYVFAALRAGASGFLLKDAPRARLTAAIRAVAAGDQPLAPSVTSRLIKRFIGGPTPSPALLAKLASLSPREAEVLRELAHGRTNAEIAEALFISDATVKTHIARLLTKLDARDRIQAIILAYEAGFIRPGAPGEL